MEPKNRKERRALKALERKLKRTITNVLFERDREDLSRDTKHPIHRSMRGASTYHQ